MMNTWLASRQGALTLSALALLSFLGRGFLDWRYEFPAQDPEGRWVTAAALTYLVLAGIWIWGLLAGANGSRGGWISNLVLALLLDVGMGLATYFIFCPPWAGCTAWPTAWYWNSSNLIFGLLAAISIAMRLRQTKQLIKT